MRIPSVVLAVVVLSGCTAFQRSTNGQWVAGTSLAPNPSVLIVPVADVVEKGEGVVGGSGAELTSAIRDTLMAHKVKVTMGEKGTVKGAFDEAASLGYDYVLTGTITQWEDNATEWSANPDRAGLSLELYEVSSRQLVATGSHTMSGSSTALVPLSPHRFVPELVDHSVATIFGWPPRVWYA